MSLKYKPVTQRILCLIFLIHQITIQYLNYRGQESKEQFVAYDSPTPVTLKQGQGHQTWYKLVETKQGYNNAKFEKPYSNSVCERAKDKVFVKSRNMSIISLEYVQESKLVVHSLPAWCS